ncbi:MAG: hypothetical protein KBB95_20590 [Deltaproteobacteria bacterium]|jgi:hypothetical protein|nr:hypothetical protein [Deltaproteobacteria bacterium]
MADTEQLERVIGLAWVVALPVTVLWTLWAMRRQANQRKALAGLLVVALPGVLIGVELAVRLGMLAFRERPLYIGAYGLVGVPLSCLWVLAGPALLTFLSLGPVETRAPRSLVAAHAVLWALTTFVGLRFAMSI